ncbi:hypothetical protein SmaMPs15_000043 [Stenotrophomonas maltophilia phage vB_SmaM_Ps15]|uniref:Uncharacterized protein n=1 Tax=Stenotrophomonas maltophilia phage vB_SmaM_Ps15 TaxID=3071007 RepID=A0AAE9JWJ8_9CAUD|nr:hypothetical protein PQC01_gp043 [Stenotrophomonas maltophilia phage vB_SmaM_Ps15]UMO77194.1 hypothetical protein SmaMPs15_000043 [Stenotrophomonas maltophilia phage vB_SmaM_Ps15]
MNTNPKLYSPAIKSDSWGDDYADMRGKGRLNDLNPDEPWILRDSYVKVEDYQKLAKKYRELEKKYNRQQRYVQTVRSVIAYILLNFQPVWDIRSALQDMLHKGNWRNHE